MPSASCRHKSPGPTATVVVASSTIAGPVIVRPGPRSSRRKTGVSAKTTQLGPVLGAAPGGSCRLGGQRVVGGESRFVDRAHSLDRHRHELEAGLGVPRPRPVAILVGPLERLDGRGDLAVADLPAGERHGEFVHLQPVADGREAPQGDVGGHNTLRPRVAGGPAAPGPSRWPPRRRRRRARSSARPPRTRAARRRRRCRTPTTPRRPPPRAPRPCRYRARGRNPRRGARRRRRSCRARNPTGRSPSRWSRAAAGRPSAPR